MHEAILAVAEVLVIGATFLGGASLLIVGALLAEVWHHHRRLRRDLNAEPKFGRRFGVRYIVGSWYWSLRLGRRFSIVFYPTGNPPA